MVESCRERIWKSIIRFYVCLSALYALVQSEDEVGCGMPKSGVTYMGSRNVTITGKVCQPWAAETPHPVNTVINDEHFPDGSKEEAKNFCRNPHPNSRFGVWCYTMDISVEWEYCDTCPGDFQKYPGCTLPFNGEEYRGKLNRTQSHMQCEPWSDHQSSQYNFPEGSAEKAKNFCRNPDPINYEAPWCFTKGMPGLNWDYCDVCKPFWGELRPQFGGYNKGSVQTADMNRLACIRWCINWQSCLAVVIPHGESGSQCWYLTALNGRREENSGWDQYNVVRLCNHRAKGRESYFIDVPRISSMDGAVLMDGSVEECDIACTMKPDCVTYDRGTQDGKCYSHTNINDRTVYLDTVNARHIIRCDPSLKPNIDISDNEAETPAPSTTSPEPSEKLLPADLKPAANQANTGIRDGSVESTEASTETTEELPVVAIATVVILVIAIGGGGVFAYYNLVYKKGKKESEKGGSKEERKKLTPKKSTTSKTSKSKK